MFQAVARDHQGKQQRRPDTPVEEAEFVSPPQVIGMMP